MINADKFIEDGTYFDNEGRQWERRQSQGSHGYVYWVDTRHDSVWHSESSFKDLVIFDQMRREEDAKVLEKAGLSGAFGTRAQSTLLTMAKMMRQGTLKEFLDGNGCQW